MRGLRDRELFEKMIGVTEDQDEADLDVPKDADEPMKPQVEVVEQKMQVDTPSPEEPDPNIRRSVRIFLRPVKRYGASHERSSTATSNSNAAKKATRKKKNPPQVL